jgi:hypothetical protein
VNYQDDNDLPWEDSDEESEYRRGISDDDDSGYDDNHMHGQHDEDDDVDDDADGDSGGDNGGDSGDEDVGDDAGDDDAGNNNTGSEPLALAVGRMILVTTDDWDGAAPAVIVGVPDLNQRFQVWYYGNDKQKYDLPVTRGWTDLATKARRKKCEKFRALEPKPKRKENWVKTLDYHQNPDDIILFDLQKDGLLPAAVQTKLKTV